jgi:hypothetical protein
MSDEHLNSGPQEEVEEMSAVHRGEKDCGDVRDHQKHDKPPPKGDSIHHLSTGCYQQAISDNSTLVLISSILI